MRVEKRFHCRQSNVRSLCRMKRSALWRFFCARSRHSAFHQPRLQIASDQLQHLFVLHLTRHSRHENIVIDAIKELLPSPGLRASASFRYVASCRFDGLVRVASGAKAVARLGELGVKQGLHRLMQRLLDQAI